MEDNELLAAMATDTGKLALEEARASIRIQGGAALDYIHARLKRARSPRDQALLRLTAAIVRRYRTGNIPSVIDYEAEHSVRKVGDNDHERTDSCSRGQSS
jgi:hypothetical protein